VNFSKKRKLFLVKCLFSNFRSLQTTPDEWLGYLALTRTLKEKGKELFVVRGRCFAASCWAKQGRGGAGTQISGSGSKSRHLNILAPAPE